MTAKARETGLDFLGLMSWGTHFCHFYHTREDLQDIVIPFLRAGIAGHEMVQWIIAGSVDRQTRDMLKRSIPRFDRHLEAGEIEMIPYAPLILENGTLVPEKAVGHFQMSLKRAAANGFAGLRVAADCAWLEERYWQAFCEFEKGFEQHFSRQNILALCAYPLGTLNASALFDVTHTHQFAIAKRFGRREVLETPELKKAQAEISKHNEVLRQTVLERTRDLEQANETLRREVEERKRAEEGQSVLQKQLLTSQKLESVGRLAGGIAHDFNNMLGAILGYTELALLKRIGDPPVRQDLEQVVAAAKRASDLVQQLLAFARKQMVHPVAIDLNASVAGMLKILRRLIGENIHLVWRPGADLWKVRIDPAQIDQLLANLLVNARDAIAGVGQVEIKTANVTLDETFCAGHPECTPQDYVLLEISDNGSGMDPETLARIFEPFFTTKEPGQGSGLGLATVYGMVKQNQGFIYADSQPGRGTTFRIYLPRFFAEAAEPRRDGNETASPGGSETVLLVEDEEAVLKVAKVHLEMLGYTVLAARSPAEAIRLAGGYPERIDLLVTDVILPDMDGRELSERLTSRRPQMKCLYMSGYSADLITHQRILPRGMHFIQKPFFQRELAQKVREALAAEPDGPARGFRPTPP